MKIWVPIINFKAVEFGRRSVNPKESKNSSRPKIYLFSAAAVAALLIGAYIWHNLSSPAVGKVAVTTQDNAPVPKLPEYQTLTTNFYSLNYPGQYTQQATDIPPPGLLDYKVLSYKLGGQPGSSTNEISIKAAPDGGITLDSTYIFYQKHSDQYKMTNKLYGGEIVDIARSIKGPPETAAMWLHGSFLMIIKITTPDKQQKIDGELKDMLSSVQWRQE